MSGVKVCTVHNVKLLEYTNRSFENEVDFLDVCRSIETDVSDESLIKYAMYAGTILESGIESCMETVKNVVHEKMKESSSVLSGIMHWKYKDLVNFDVSKFMAVKLISVK